MPAFCSWQLLSTGSSDDGRLVGILTRADFVSALQLFLVSGAEKAVVSDAEINERVLAEINHQPWSKNCSLDVSVKGGVVTLGGGVPSEDHRSSVRIAAENVPGVNSVDERLEVMEIQSA